MVKPRLLVTRFAPHAQQVAEKLNEQGIFSIAQPLLKIEEVEHPVSIFHKPYDIVIAISCNAVEYSDKQCKNTWPNARYFAVGKATQLLLTTKIDQSVFIPETDFSSEGLLALPMLQQLTNQTVLILRGVGGREFLRDQLILRGASVDYYESYQRVAIKLSRSTTAHKWQQQAINGAIISSIELLEQLIKITAYEDQRWLKSLTLFASSERILEYATNLGFQKTVLLASISNQELINYFTDEGSYDRD